MAGWTAHFPKELADILSMGHQFLQEKTMEIRFRSGRPIMISDGQRMLAWDGAAWQKELPAGKQGAFSEGELRKLFEHLTGGSLYRLEEELQNGYLTLPGGHRLGFCGRAVLEKGKIKTMREISFMNFRLAREVPGCLEPWIELLVRDKRWLSTLIIAPPLGGKTTLLREMIRLASGGTKVKGITIPGYNVSVVDERSELAGSWRGIPQFDLGPRSDVLDGCPKAQGMMLMIRSMGPQILAVDEIGKKEDIEALKEAIACGITVFATVHGRSREEVEARPGMQALLDNSIFERILLLGG
ncbi:MAG: stage III sporulation protein AA [Clostridiales bacterium]